MPWPQNRRNPIPCTVRASRQRSCNQRVDCLQWMNLEPLIYIYLLILSTKQNKKTIREIWDKNPKKHKFCVTVQSTINNCFVIDTSKMNANDIRLLTEHQPQFSPGMRTSNNQTNQVRKSSNQVLENPLIKLWKIRDNPVFCSWSTNTPPLF